MKNDIETKDIVLGADVFLESLSELKAEDLARFRPKTMTLIFMENSVPTQFPTLPAYSYIKMYSVDEPTQYSKFCISTAIYQFTEPSM